MNKHRVLWPLAALGLLPLAAQAATVTLTPATPSFVCAPDGGDAGGRITWPNGVQMLTPTLAYLDDTGAEIDGDASPLDCNDGGFSEGVSERKAKKGQREYLIVKMTEVFVTAAPDIPPGGSPVQWNAVSVLRELVQGVEVWDTTWHLLWDHLLLDPQTGALAGRSRNYLGLQFTSWGAFEGMDQVRFAYDLSTTTLSFVAPLQAQAGTLSLLDRPSAVPEPGTLPLLAASALALAFVGRRRRSAKLG